MGEFVTVAENEKGLCVICGKRPGELRHTLPAQMVCPICWKEEVCFFCGGQPDKFIDVPDGTLYACDECVDLDLILGVLSVLIPDVMEVEGLEVGEYDHEAGHESKGGP